MAKLRDLRCKYSEAEIATALHGRFRVEHVTELKVCAKMWEQYQVVIADTKKEESAYAEQVPERLEKQLQRRARELVSRLVSTGPFPY